MSEDELVEELLLLSEQQQHRRRLAGSAAALDLPEDGEFHDLAVDLLLQFIDSGRVMTAFRRVEKVCPS